MQRNDVIDLISSQRQSLYSMFGVKHLSLFGSVARDEAREDSDVDVLVEFEGELSFDRFMELKFFLEDLLKTRVDLVTVNALKAKMRPLIEKESVLVAGLDTVSGRHS